MKFRQLGLCLLGTVLFLAAAAWGEQASNQGTSLGDLAKQEQTRRMKVKQEHSVRTWSNDNMPKRPAGEGVTAATGMSAAPPPPPEGSTPAASTSPEAASSGDAASGPETHDESYYRKSQRPQAKHPTSASNHSPDL